MHGIPTTVGPGHGVGVSAILPSWLSHSPHPFPSLDLTPSRVLKPWLPLAKVGECVLP